MTERPEQRMTEASDHDDRLARHLHGLAATIELTPGAPAVAVGRARRRRQRRHAGLGAALGAVAVLGAVVVVDARPDEEIQAGTPSEPLADIALDWTVVDPDVSALVGPTSTAADGTVYGLSTAPGVVDLDDPPPEAFRQVLYRSTDGAEWAEAELPDDLWATALTTAGDTVYAVGTGAVGGDARSLRLVASADGAATWTDLEVPDDLAELDARYPDEIQVYNTDVAAGPGGLVMAVTVAGVLDLSERLPGGLGPNVGWATDDDGVTVYDESCAAELEPARCVEDMVPGAVPAIDVTSLPPPTTAVGDEPTVGGRYTWAELGVDDELRDLVVRPRTHLFAAAPGDTDLVEVDRSELTGVDEGPTSAGPVDIVAVADGFRLVVTDDRGMARVHRSADGRTWDQPPVELAGYPLASGVIAGRPAYMTETADGDGPTVVLAVESGTTMSQVTLFDAPSIMDAYGMAGAIGPLGAVLWFTSDRGGVGSFTESILAVSTDATSVTEVDLTDYLDAPLAGLGPLVVSADAISVTVLDPHDDDEVPPRGSRVLVGTPRG